MPPDSSPGRIYTEIKRFSPQRPRIRSRFGLREAFAAREADPRRLEASPGAGRSWRRPGATGTRSREQVAETGTRCRQRARQPLGPENGGSPHQPHPGTRVRRCRCSLPGLTGFTTWRCEGTDADRHRPCASARRRGRISRAPTQTPSRARQRCRPGLTPPAAPQGRRVWRPGTARSGRLRTRRVSLTLCTPRERCPSGRRSTPGKCVYVDSVPRVRIPPSPPMFFNASVVSVVGTGQCRCNCNGLMSVKPGKRKKSRSADQSTRTPVILVVFGTRSSGTFGHRVPAADGRASCVDT